MKIPMDQAPHLVAACRQSAESARLRYRSLADQGSAEQDPARCMQIWRNAQEQLDIALKFEADAEDLTRQFLAAGGEIHKLH